MSDRSDAAALSYLERLLRVAVAQRGAPPNPAAGRVMLPVLGMAMAYGGNELIATYLTPDPDAPAVYEVRRLGPGDTEATVLSDDLNAVAALRSAVRYSREGMGGIQIVGRTAARVERRAINRTSDGVLEYLFPSEDTYRGPEDAVTAARERWDDQLRRWGTEDGTTAPTDAGATIPADVSATGAAATASEIAAAIQSSLMEMTVDINLTEVRSQIRQTIESTFGEFAATSRPPPSGPAGPEGPEPAGSGGHQQGPEPAGSDTDPPADRTPAGVVDRISPSRASANHPTVRLVSAKSQAADDRAAEQIAAMVAYQIDSFLEALSPDGIGPVEALRQIEPVLGGIEVTQKQLLAQVANQVGFEARVGNALEQLELQVGELREHTRTAAAALRSLTEQVALLSRRSEMAGERLSAAVGSELDQFGDRFKHQLETVESAAKRTARDMPVPDAVTRLTARLGRSEAQLDQILKRLNAMAPPETGPTPGPNPGLTPDPRPEPRPRAEPRRRPERASTSEPRQTMAPRRPPT